MTDDVKRPYRSQRRREQAGQTRARILEAATTVFLQRGFDRATISSIAAEADVADETIYVHFSNKRTLLAQLVQEAVRGDDARPVPDQGAPRALAAVGDQKEQLRLFAADIVRRLERAAPLLAVVKAAAVGEPELAQLYGVLQADRLRNLRTLVDALERNEPLRMPSAAATETVWALTSPELHQLLVGVRGWSRKRYTTWLAESLSRLLLLDAGV